MNKQGRGKSFGEILVQNLKYRTLIEALQNGESLNSSQIITLFILSKKRKSDIEEDIKNYKAPI
jgi:hypothetical protein